MLTNEQKERRHNGLGGSDIAVIAGLGYSKTPLDIYVDKVMKVECESTSPMRAGNHFEKPIRDFWAQERNVSLHDVDTVYHPEHSFLLGHPDAIDEQGGVIEIKNMGIRAALSCGYLKEFEFPHSYIIQVMYYCHLMDAPYGKLVCYMGGDEFREWTYQRNDETRLQELKLVECGVNFWTRHVVPKIPPPASQISTLKLLYPRGDEKEVHATPEIEEAVKVLASLKENIRTLSKEEEQLQVRICEFLKEASALVNDEGTLCTWKNASRTLISKEKLKDLQPDLVPLVTTNTEYRTFRLGNAATVH